LIPNSLLALAIFLASIGPGFVHVRIAERRGPRGLRTPLTELAELAVVGSAATVAAAAIWLGIGELVHALEAGRLLTDTDAYFDDEPGAIVAFVLLSLATSYALAIGAATILYKGIQHGKPPKSFSENTTGWVQAMFSERPHENTVVLAVVELSDGKKVSGVVRGFTAESGENRELRLTAPIAITRAKDGLLEEADSLDFVLLRERDIRSIIGRYVPGKNDS
jgi:Family of unknown function (DUF6338)